jgi:hypothetical protein
MYATDNVTRRFIATEHDGKHVFWDIKMKDVDS